MRPARRQGESDGGVAARGIAHGYCLHDLTPLDLQRRKLNLFDGSPLPPASDQLGLEQAIHHFRDRVNAPIVANSFSGPRFRTGGRGGTTRGGRTS